MLSHVSWASTVLASGNALFACLPLQTGAWSLAIMPVLNAAPSAVLCYAPPKSFNLHMPPCCTCFKSAFFFSPCFSIPLELCCYETGETFQLKLCWKTPERSSACLGILEKSCGSALDHICRRRWRMNSLAQALGCC